MDLFSAWTSVDISSGQWVGALNLVKKRCPPKGMRKPYDHQLAIGMQPATMRYIDRVIAACTQAKNASPVSEFDMNELDDLNGIQSAIYIIEQTSGSPEQAFQEMKRYKSKRIRACPKLNKPSKVMYVGSSTTNLKNRIKQHLGYGPAQTYALHLDQWFKEHYRITVTTYDLPPNILQIVEDDLADTLKPAFGKSGPNNM